jgi:hypothetical protein
MPRGADDPAEHSRARSRPSGRLPGIAPSAAYRHTPRNPLPGVPHRADPARSPAPHINRMEGPVATRGTRRAVGPREPTKKGYR